MVKQKMGVVQTYEKLNLETYKLIDKVQMFKYFF